MVTASSGQPRRPLCRFAPASRRVWRDRVELAILLGSATALLLGVGLSRVTGEAMLVGLWRRFTGIPCPLCRGSRAAEALATAQPWDALVWNPLATLLILSALAWLTMRLGLGRRMEIAWTARRRRLAWTAATAAVLANWAYVIAAGG